MVDHSWGGDDELGLCVECVEGCGGVVARGATVCCGGCCYFLLLIVAIEAPVRFLEI